MNYLTNFIDGVFENGTTSSYPQDYTKYIYQTLIVSWSVIFTIQCWQLLGTKYNTPTSSPRTARELRRSRRLQMQMKTHTNMPIQSPIMVNLPCKNKSKISETLLQDDYIMVKSDRDMLKRRFREIVKILKRDNETDNKKVEMCREICCVFN